MSSNNNEEDMTDISSKYNDEFVLVIDTETTGLPPRYVDITNTEKWNKCRIVQIAWEVLDLNGNIISSECYIIKPNGFDIPTVASNIHGITTEIANEKGIDIDIAFNRLESIINGNIKTIVAHNMQFDDAVIQSEIYRQIRYSKNNDSLNNLYDKWRYMTKECTMLMGCTKPGQKWPKLVELYKTCFNKEPVGNLHQADVDVRACAEIYFHLKKQ